jgi:ABC-type Zn uptake system ZnuABC Zn-binding protein ZnuA
VPTVPGRLRRLLAPTVLAVAALCSACTTDSDSPTDAADTTIERPRVVVGREIVGAIAEAALGDDAIVDVEPGNDAIDRAVLAALAPIPFGEGPAWASPPAGGADVPALGDPDPAFWLDPDRVTQAARLIAADVELSPDARARTDVRLDELADAMRHADEQVQAMFAAFAPERWPVATANIRLGYFAERYGLVIVPADGSDPLSGLDVDRLGAAGSPTGTLDGLLVEVGRRITERTA